MANDILTIKFGFNIGQKMVDESDRQLVVNSLVKLTTRKQNSLKVYWFFFWWGAGSSLYIEPSDEPISKACDDPSARNEPPREQDSRQSQTQSLGIERQRA